MKRIVLLAALLCGWLATGAGAAEFRAGVGRACITPQTALWMSGYAARTKPSEGALHDLWAKALALDDGAGGRAVLVATDLIGLPRGVADDIAARLKAKHGLERPQIVLNSTHTHGGPAVRPNLSVMFDMNAEDLQRANRYCEKLVADVVAAVDAALNDLAPAVLSVGHGQAHFGVNRRQPVGAGFRIGVNAQGSMDPDVPVLKVAAPDGKLRAALFGYACHNTTLGADIYQFHGDYAGFAQTAFEKAHPGATALFFELCAADQNPNPRGKVENAQEYGRALADEVDRVLRGELRPVRGPIRTAFQLANLELAPHDRETFAKEAQGTDRFRRRRAELMLKAYDAGKPVRAVECPVQAVRFGADLTLLALGGEVVVDYALRLKKEFPQENLIVAGYSNDVMCYIPTVRVLEEGGYEPVDSMIYYGQPGPFAESVEDAVLAACRAALEKTRGR